MCELWMCMCLFVCLWLWVYMHCMNVEGLSSKVLCQPVSLSLVLVIGPDLIIIIMVKQEKEKWLASELLESRREYCKKSLTKP